MNKNIPYYDIIMRCTDFHNVKIAPLPMGFHFKFYEDGDEYYWAKLETDVNEFENIDSALDYFHRTFTPFKEFLFNRMIFVIDPNGEYVATSTAWFKDDDKRHYALLHWVCVSLKQRSNGLGNCVVSYALANFITLEPYEKEVFLHTQTWSFKAIGLYYKFGFKITDQKLVNSVTDFDALSVLKEVLPKKITDHLIES